MGAGGSGESVSYQDSIPSTTWNSYNETGAAAYIKDWRVMGGILGLSVAQPM